MSPCYKCYNILHSHVTSLFTALYWWNKSKMWILHMLLYNFPSQQIPKGTLEQDVKYVQS